ncbi:hypothetical protein Bca4012_049715 [Brassica carinata]
MFRFFLAGSLASHYLNSYYVLVLKIDFGRCEAIHSLSLCFTQSLVLLSLHNSLWEVSGSSYLLQEPFGV